MCREGREDGGRESLRYQGGHERRVATGRRLGREESNSWCPREECGNGQREAHSDDAPISELDRDTQKYEEECLDEEDGLGEECTLVIRKLGQAEAEDLAE